MADLFKIVGGDKDGSDKSEGGKESGVSRGNEGRKGGVLILYADVGKKRKEGKIAAEKKSKKKTRKKRRTERVGKP